MSEIINIKDFDWLSPQGNPVALIDGKKHILQTTFTVRYMDFVWELIDGNGSLSFPAELAVVNRTARNVFLDFPEHEGYRAPWMKNGMGFDIYFFQPPMRRDPQTGFWTYPIVCTEKDNPTEEHKGLGRALRQIQRNGIPVPYRGSGVIENMGPPMFGRITEYDPSFDPYTAAERYKSLCRENTFLRRRPKG